MRPRLDSLGADVTLIASLRAVVDTKRRPVSLETDLLTVELAIEKVNATLLVIDPLSAYLGRNVNAWRDDDVRRIMDPLAEMAARKAIAVLGLVHMTKASDRAALYRSQGSIAFVAAARSVLALALDPDDAEHKTKRVLVHVKSNLSLLADALELDVAPPLTWGSERRLAADAALGPRRADQPDATTKAEACAGVIRDVVREAGGSPPADEARKLVRSRMPGVSDSTIDRARVIAGVKYIRPAVVGGQFHWTLGVDETHLDETAATAPNPTRSADLASRQPANGRRDERKAPQPTPATRLAVSSSPVSSTAHGGFDAANREPGDDDPDAVGWTR